MKLGNQTEKLNIAKEEAMKILNNSEDKSQAIVEAIEVLSTALNEDLIKSIKADAVKAESDIQYAKSLNLRILNEEEVKFYEALKDVKQAITANQIDILPTSIVDRTLEDVKEESGVLDLVEFAPADVKKWFTAEKTGTFSWGGLTAEISGELGATFKALNIEVSKLSVYLIIPKAIRDLALPFVDKYFTAILKEAMTDGLEYGFLQGNGKEQPIGIYNSITKSTDGIHQAKDLNADLTSFKPKGLASAKKYLSNNGKRKIKTIVLVCHPNDEADYVSPAMYDDEGKNISSYKYIEVKTSVNNPEGKAALVLPKKYAMGFSGFSINEYDQTKALEDADVVIGKVYANGRATDDNTAYVFDVTKLEEYVKKVNVIDTVQGA